MTKASLLASLGAKAAIGGAVLVLASAGSAVAWKASGNMDAAHNSSHGAAQIVQNCKTQVRGTDPDPNVTHKPQGIGECVSDQVQHQGQQNSDVQGANESPSPSAKPGKHLGNGNGNGQGSNGNGQGNDSGAQGANADAQGGNSDAQGGNANAQGNNGNGQGNNGNGQGNDQQSPSATAKGAENGAANGQGSATAAG